MNQNPEDEYEEQVADNVELQQEANEDYMEDNSPTYNRSDDLYSLFWKVLNIKDSSKVGNIDKNELGMLDISVRDCQKIAMTARILGEPEFAEWMDIQAQIILKTSSSRRGWFTELFVTAKRFASKEKRLGVPDSPGPNADKPKGFWARLRGK